MSVSMPAFLAADADEYEHFMGRWSRRLAGPFLDFAGVRPGDRVLDVGCGKPVVHMGLAVRRWGHHVPARRRRPAWPQHARRSPPREPFRTACPRPWTGFRPE